MNLQVAEQRAEARGDKKQEEGFSGAVRSTDLNNLVKGDKFKIPTDYVVYQTTIGSNKAEYIFVECESGEVKQLFAGAFSKSRAEVDEAGNPTGIRVKVTGDVVDMYQSFAKVGEAFDALAEECDKGNSIELTDVHEANTISFQTNKVVKTQFPEYNFVADAPAPQRRRGGR